MHRRRTMNLTHSRLYPRDSYPVVPVRFGNYIQLYTILHIINGHTFMYPFIIRVFGLSYSCYFLFSASFLEALPKRGSFGSFLGL